MNSAASSRVGRCVYAAQNTQFFLAHIFEYASLLINNQMQVTWVEHSEYDESAVHQLYRSILSSGRGFGAQRWVATLQRSCECMTILMSPTISDEDQTGLAMHSELLLVIT